MPKAKRRQQVNLHQTKKKTKQIKEQLLTKVQEFLKEYENVVIFTFQSMTTNGLRELQTELSDCKFCLGKKKVMKLAFGQDEDSEPFLNAHLIGSKLHGETGLIFTNRDSEEIVNYLNNYSVAEFANPGCISIADVELLSGKDVFKGYPTSNEEYLKKLGLDLEISDANIYLVKPFLAAEKGKPLTVEQSKILKFLGIKLSQFRVIPTAFWSKSGDFVEYDGQ